MLQIKVYALHPQARECCFLFKNQGHFIQESKCGYWNKDSTHLCPKEYFIFVWLCSPGKCLTNGFHTLFCMNSRKFLWNIEETPVVFPFYQHISHIYWMCSSNIWRHFPNSHSHKHIYLRSYIAPDSLAICLSSSMSLLIFELFMFKEVFVHFLVGSPLVS